jgi:putative membrane protein (TIGR04086 family)
MEPNRRSFFSARTLVCLLWGVGVGILSALLLTLLFAALLSAGIPDGWISFFAFATALLSAFAGGFVAGRKGGEGGLVKGLLCGLALGGLHFGIALLWGEITTALLLFPVGEILSGALGGILGVNLRR